MIMSQMIISFFGIILVIFSHANSQTSHPQFTIKAESGRAFDDSYLVGTFEIANGNIGDCLEHCLENCSCQSFQVCGSSRCQLCSSHKEYNSSLLRDQNDCTYAMYEIRNLTKSFQKIADQCSGMSCLLKYNCCQQSGLCPNNRICRAINSFTQPWKRYICDCPDGYHGDSCNEPIKSCRGYSNAGFRKSGRYKIFGDSDNPDKMYEVYCHFDSDVAWTLVQSYSYANYKSNNHKSKNFRKPLYEDEPVNRNSPTLWEKYRLTKNKMKSIQNDSDLLGFTCNYEKHPDNVEHSDYLVIPMKQSSVIDVVDLDGKKQISEVHGEIARFKIDNCSFQLKQGGGNNGEPLHLDMDDYYAQCSFQLPTCNQPKKVNYFGNYKSSCLDENRHSCVMNPSSTTQLWFGSGAP